MDESWRMRMGMPYHSRRRSNDAAAMNRSRQFGSGNRKPDVLDAEDFADVFGGPPRTIVGRKMSVDMTNCKSFYEEIFRTQEMSAPGKRSGRSLRPFSIPAMDGEFYGDIFGSYCGDRVGMSRTSSKGKSNSSSMLSSDSEMSSFTSKLRPINTPCRWNSSTMTPSSAEQPKSKSSAPAGFQYNSPSGSENQYMESFAYKSSYQGFSSQNVTSPDIINLEPSSYRAMKVSPSDLDLQSSSSGLSSLCQDWEDKGGFLDNFDHTNNDRMQEQGHDDDDDDSDEDDEVMSSYVIEINSDHYRDGNDEAIDEAVAWAKEKYQRHSPENDAGAQTEHSIPRPKNGKQDKGATEAKQQSPVDVSARRHSCVCTRTKCNREEQRPLKSMLQPRSLPFFCVLQIWCTVGNGNFNWFLIVCVTILCIIGHKHIPSLTRTRLLITLQV